MTDDQMRQNPSPGGGQQEVEEGQTPQPMREPNPFQTYLPGYPPQYFEGLLPKPSISETLFAPMGTPAYNWRQLEEMTTEKPRPDTVWRPQDPTSMYVSCLSWVAYPYGIPAADQPCPYYRDNAKPLDQASASSSDTSSLTSLSDTSGTDDGNEGLEIRDSKGLVTTAPHHEIYQHYAWTGK